MLYSKEDLINELRNYIDILKIDSLTTENEKHILRNVIGSLQEMIIDFNK